MLPRVWSHLDHVILAVRDLAAAERCYARLLGRSAVVARRASRARHRERAVPDWARRTSSCSHRPAGAGDWLRGRLAERGEGLLGFALATDDADACAKALAERGLHPQPPARGIGRDTRVRRLPRVAERDAAARRDARRARSSGSSTARRPSCCPRSRRRRARGGGPRHRPRRGADRRRRRHPRAVRRAPRPAPRARPELPAVGRAAALLPRRSHHGRSRGASRRRARTRPRGPGLGLSWRVRDADAARARLAEAGFDVSEVRHRPKARARRLHRASGDRAACADALSSSRSARRGAEATVPVLRARWPAARAAQPSAAFPPTSRTRSCASSRSATPSSSRTTTRIARSRISPTSSATRSSSRRPPEGRPRRDRVLRRPLHGRDREDPEPDAHRGGAGPRRGLLARRRLPARPVPPLHRRSTRAPRCSPTSTAPPK